MLAPDEQGIPLDHLRFSLASDIVELVVLTGDQSFLQTLREAVGGARRLWHVPSADKVSDLLVAGEVGILVLDEAALHQSPDVFITQIKRQFPDLVIVVAGKRDAETALAPLISTGIVYRFIHKPMSPGRAKLFADAAVKKYDEQRRRLASTVLPARPAGGRRPLVTAMVLLAVVAAAAGWLAFHGAAPRPAADPEDLADARLEQPSPQLVRAAAALAANRLIAPSGDNALELYLQALHNNPHDPQARAGLNEVHERLAARAENALLEERLSEAATAIDVARKSGVDPGRITFLNGQLARARERQRAAQPPAEGQPEALRPLDSTVAHLLALANERRLASQYTSPDHDSARYYVLEAARLRPDADAVADSKEALALAMLSDVRSAIDRRDFDRADGLLRDADGIASSANLDSVRRQLDDARLQAEAAAHEQLARNAAERLQQDHLIEPANDNASYYVLTLRAVEPGHTALVGLIQELGVRLVAKAKRALALEQYDAARSWLAEVSNIGYASTESAEVTRSLDEALAHAKFLSDVVPAGELSVLKTVQPAYPAQAQQAHIEGWVELDFTVTEAGRVRDIVIHKAKPEGVFNDAATAALTQWIYRPVLRDGQSVPQRARVRIRFTLAE